MRQFEGKVALVTGAGRGIGEAIARRLAAEGAKVVLTDKLETGIAGLGAELREGGCTAMEIVADVTSVSDINRMVQSAIAEYGRIDILINNAGTIRPTEFLTMTEEDWDFIQRVDLKGLVMCTQRVAAGMVEQKYGKIVNISSMCANRVYLRGYASYAAAKAAVNNFTQYVARELGVYNINVNAVTPGEILTSLTYQDQTKEAVEKKLEKSKEMTMLKKLGSTADVANLVLFLASDAASFITAEIISVDGGRIDRL